MIKMRFAIISLILFVSTGCSKYPDLGHGYRLDSDGQYTLQIVDSQNTIKIRQHILDFAFDSTFIIAVQRPWDSVPNIRTMKFKDANKAFEKSTFEQYWILDKTKKGIYSDDSIHQIARYSNVFGPFNKLEYLKCKENLKVSKKMKLKKE
jgi:hypothetical protein